MIASRDFILILFYTSVISLNYFLAFFRIYKKVITFENSKLAYDSFFIELHFLFQMSPESSLHVNLA